MIKGEVDEMEISILESSPVACYSCDLNGHITYFNRAAEEVWGCRPAIGKDLWSGAWKLFYLDGTSMEIKDHPAYQAIYLGIFLKKSKFRIQRPDKSFKTLLFIPQPQYDSNKNLIGGHFTLIDFSEYFTDHYKQATLSSIVESSDDAIISKDLNGRITSWNAGAQRIFGYSEGEALGESITMLIPESRLKEEEKIISALKKGKRIEHFETMRLDSLGREIPLSLTISPVKDIHGNVVGASKVARDITDRLKNFEKQSILSAIVESSDDAIISKNLDGIIMSWNRGAQKIFGYSEEEAIGNSITMLIPKNKIQEEVLIIEKIKKGEKIDHFETIRRHKSGKKLNVSITVSPVKDHKGNIIGASKVARDISLQVQSQEALKKYSTNLELLHNVGKLIGETLDVEEILKKIINVTTELTISNFGIFYYDNEDAEGNAYNYFANSGASKGVVERLKEFRSDDLFPDSFQVLLIEDIDKAEYKKANFYQYLKSQLDYKSYMAVPVVAKSGQVIGGLLYGHSKKDHFTSEHKLIVANIASQASASLENSKLFERVKSLSEKKDEFIALASHELKTPLTTVKGYIQLLSKMNNEEKASFFIHKALKQVDKLHNLIEDLLNMSRIEKGKLELSMEAFDIREMLLEIIQTFNYSSSSHQIKHRLGNTPVKIVGDPQRIEQVIINLITNAIKYSPQADLVKVILETSSGATTVKVCDSGIGLSIQQQKNLFTRFYRAENSRGISGLGRGLLLS